MDLELFVSSLRSMVAMLLHLGMQALFYAVKPLQTLQIRLNTPIQDWVNRSKVWLRVEG